MQALGHHLGAGSERRPFGQDDELVPAQPAHGVAGPQHPHEAVRHGLEHLVPGVVPQ